MRIATLLVAALLALASPTAAHAYTVERETTTTADGVPLVLKRLKTPGAVPVLLVHGLGANGDEWDLPSKSMARFLAQQGFDVWVASCRRTGRAPYRSGGRAGYSFDDLACLDMPALVEKVAAATGERPFLVGHSMGGMMVEAWLQGVAYERTLVRREPRVSLAGVRIVDVFADRVAADPARRAARHAAIRGAVAIASPPRFDWEARQASVFDFWRHDFWNYNLVVRELAWSPAATAASYVVPEVPAGRVVRFLTEDLLALPYLGAAARPFLRAVTGQVGTSLLSSQVLYGPNMEDAVIQEGLALAVDDASNGVHRQLLDGVRTRSFREAATLDVLRRPYVYADHHDAITAPILLVGGRRDKLCNDESLARNGYGRISSADKTLLIVDAGHADLVIGRAAPQDVWAPVAAWLQARK